MNALKLLQDLDYRSKLIKYPGVPREAITVSRFNDKTSNGLTACIIRWMELHGHWATRITTTGRQLEGSTITDVIGRTRTTPGKWIPGTTKKGTADIHAIVNGRHCSIEVKVGLDRMSHAQYKTKQQVELSGGLYMIATDFESFIKWYEAQV